MLPELLDYSEIESVARVVAMLSNLAVGPLRPASAADHFCCQVSWVIGHEQKWSDADTSDCNS